ncbi:Os08g0172300, partial [Oryza sativa Japonica Group]
PVVRFLNTELLLCMASFNPIDSFAAYNKENLVSLLSFIQRTSQKQSCYIFPFSLLSLSILFVKMKGLKM